MPEIINRIKIAKSFGAASASYDVSSRLQRFCGKKLMPWLPHSDNLTALDLGSGTGYFTNILATKYEKVLGLDHSKQMLQYASNNSEQQIYWLEGDAHKLPLQDASIDFIFSNLVIQWFNPLETAVTEILRVLKPGGWFIFTTLLDGTLHELKSSWAQVDEDAHVINFLSEQQVINTFTAHAKLVQCHTQDVVLEYENVLHLARELKGLGANHVPMKTNRGLAGKDKWRKMTNAYEDFVEPSGIYPATYRLFSAMVMKPHD
jgi:malonyl-CoA O-methyltransferase